MPSITETVASDQWLCGKCGATFWDHDMVNRHTPTKPPMMRCKKTRAVTPVAGFALQHVVKEIPVTLCDGCGEPIRRGGLLAPKDPDGSYTSGMVTVHADPSNPAFTPRPLPSCLELARAKAAPPA